ncbi:hypothetical protein [Methylomonas sp. MK1]|uniref:hypothetical protein n=1 Tax=Methylomonas sp. MK1 TaxID=1131552 RepID=UPI0003681DBB|nr:hypothetical protein [Methylomonas sp. MK1]
MQYQLNQTNLTDDQQSSMNIPREDEENALYSQIGFVVVQWGHCEQSLELLVNTLFLQYGSNNLPKRKRMPKQLGEKIAFVKECTSLIPSLAPFRNEIEDLLGNFEALTQTRHDLVHGALSDSPPVNGVYSFIRLETHPETHEIKEFQYDLKAFPNLAGDLVRLGADTPKIARRVFEASPRMFDYR